MEALPWRAGEDVTWLFPGVLLVADSETTRSVHPDLEPFTGRTNDALWCRTKESILATGRDFLPRSGVTGDPRRPSPTRIFRPVRTLPSRIADLRAFLIGYVAGLLAIGLGWLAAVGGMVFSVQGLPVEEWWFGAFSWLFDVFDSAPSEFTIGFLFGVASGAGGATRYGSEPGQDRSTRDD